MYTGKLHFFENKREKERERWRETEIGMGISSVFLDNHNNHRKNL